MDKPTEEKKKSFLDMLSNMNDEEILEYIHKNGKSNTVNKLFAYVWDTNDSIINNKPNS